MLAVITGASSGIGAMFARKLAARGYDLLLVARREERLRGIASELAAAHKIKAEALTADLTSDSGRELVAERIRRAPDLGLLVNNAGFGTNGYFFEADSSGQDQMHRLHVLNVVSLSHAALANMTANADAAVRKGVINVSSVAAFWTAPLNVSYCATKAWMNTFSEGLALELAARGLNVTVQALCPGYTLSEFHDVTGTDRSRIPRSLWMTAESVVAESLRCFDQGRLIVVPGWRYKLMTGFMRVMPNRIMRAVATAAVRRYRLRRA